MNLTKSTQFQRTIILKNGDLFKICPSKKYNLSVNPTQKNNYPYSLEYNL